MPAGYTLGAAAAISFSTDEDVQSCKLVFCGVFGWVSVGGLSNQLSSRAGRQCGGGDLCSVCWE